MKWPIYILILLISSSFIFAAQDVVINQGENSLEISYPLIESGYYNTKFYPYFHINNKSNGYAYREGDNINCTLEIYNQRGGEIFEAWNNTFDDFDIYIDIPENLFNSTGIYSYFIYCESIDEQIGGKVLSTIEIIEDYPLSENILPIIIVQAFATLILIFLVKTTFDSDFDKIGFWFAFTCSVLAVLQFISMLVTVYVQHTEGNLSPLLLTNMIVYILVGGFWFSTLIIFVSMKMIDISPNSDKWNDIGPGKKW